MLDSTNVLLNFPIWAPQAPSEVHGCSAWGTQCEEQKPAGGVDLPKGFYICYEL